jgi:hypothetical protein
MIPRRTKFVKLTSSFWKWGIPKSPWVSILKLTHDWMIWGYHRLPTFLRKPPCSPKKRICKVIVSPSDNSWDSTFVFRKTRETRAYKSMNKQCRNMSHMSGAPLSWMLVHIIFCWLSGPLFTCKVSIIAIPRSGEISVAEHPHVQRVVQMSRFWID